MLETIITCLNCNTPILKCNTEVLANFDSDTSITVAMYKSILPGRDDPKPGDRIECPKCGHNYIEELRYAWKLVKTVREWDS